MKSLSDLSLDSKMVISNKAIKVSDSEYNLILNYDYNTNGHTQWYYFKMMTKLKKGTSVKLNILNLMKPDSLYNYGMKP